MTRRNVCIVAFACIIAAPWLRAEGSPRAEELLMLDGKELVAAADDASLRFYSDECPYTASELIAVAEKLISWMKSPGSARGRGEPRNPFTQYFEQACLKANDRQLDKLVEIFGHLEPRLGERAMVLPALASRLVSREVASIRAEKGKATLAKTEPVLPPELRASPPELQGAWRAYQRAKAAFESAFPAVEVQIEASANEKSFYKLIDAALKGSTGLEDEIRQFGSTGANCLGVTDGGRAGHSHAPHAVARAEA